MSGTTVTPAPAGFFQGSQVNQQTAQDLIAATVNALAAAAAATTSATTANAAATSASTAAASAASSLASIGASVTNAAASATAAASSASGASTSATNAAASATSATASASSATTSATTATGSASAAGTSATNAASSATNASASASAASTSATAAAASATTAQSYGSAILNNSALTGVPTAPTASALTNNTQVSTTAYTDAAVAAEATLRSNADALKAPLASPALTGTPTAPTASVGTSSTQLATTAFAAGIAAQAQENVGRNLIHNGEFTITQRGAGPFTSVGYTADRWILNNSTSTASVTLTAAVDADRTAIGDEAVFTKLVNVVGGTAGAGDFVEMQQRLESVQRYGGKTLTVSFWAKASAGTPSIGIGGLQNFGTGGSPSANVTINATAVVLSTTWTRYSAQVVFPTTIGKTLGSSAGTDYTQLNFWFSSGATNNTAAGGIGVQSATFSIWGVQAEVGSSATTFEKIGQAQQVLQCLRFFLAITAFVGAAATYVTSITFPVPMRVTPTQTGGGAGFGTQSLTNLGVYFNQTTAAAQAMTYSADL